MKAETQNTSLHFIENLAQNAWPCYIQEKIDNWRMRATFGVSKRANSVHTSGSMPE
ncbi:acetyltransferase [Priestia endophytica]|uniref:acetyltransferase n=1 Tax=Priestia endophytica TaxID=135735 RepID=UPI001F5BEEEB|nr:acetyltransferase [Priestia endophytica]